MTSVSIGRYSHFLSRDDADRLYSAATLPNGGEKGSGWGRGNAAYSMHEYLTIKTITVGMKKNRRPVFA